MPDRRLEAARVFVAAVRAAAPHTHTAWAQHRINDALRVYDKAVGLPERPVNPSTRDAADC